MSKAEEYIGKNTNQFSNEDGFDYIPWLAPDQARRAVEIAKDEMIDKTLAFLKKRLHKDGYVGIIDLYDDYIKAMKDE